MSRTLHTPGSWVQDAACAQVDPELFFPNKGGCSAPAKLVCRRCPVMEECREYAVTSPTLLDGIWGGTTVMQRRELRRKRGITTVSEVFDSIMCGTEAGARRHYRAGEKPCQACLTASRVATRERREA